MIDCRRSLEIAQADSAEPCDKAVVILQDEFLYALLVDGHEDITEAISGPEEISGSYGAGWERVAQGLIHTSIGSALLVDVAGLITGPVAKAA